MENASKALIMAASILLGIMIISVGVALFNSFSEFGKETTDKIFEMQVSEFNNNFFKYYGNITTDDDGKVETRQIEVTAHDIISVVNFAKQNNINYNLENEDGYKEGSYYVQVDVNINHNNNKYKNFEKKDENICTNFIKEYALQGTEIKKFKCSSIKTSSKTGRVIYIKFEEY